MIDPYSFMVSLRKVRTGPCLVLGMLLFSAMSGMVRGEIAPNVFQDVQKKVVKIYGAGGLSSVKGYGTGFVVSPKGEIATVWSPVLDTPRLDLVFWDGRRFEGELSAVDSRRDLALIRLVPQKRDGETNATEFPHFDLSRETAVVEPGARILAFSNVFRVAAGDEPVSVMRGIIAAKTPLEARRGRTEISFSGPVYLLDTITNNSGAAGGVVVTPRGKLVGVIGKELRNSQSNTFVNYAMPIDSLAPAVKQLLAGGESPALDLDEPGVGGRKNRVTSLELGIVTVPEVVVRTPAYIDAVLPGTTAAQAGLQTDDLIMFADEQIVTSCREWEEALSRHARGEPLKMVVRRGGRLMTFELEVSRAAQ